jgi:hypothetical protein
MLYQGNRQRIEFPVLTISVLSFFFRLCGFLHLIRFFHFVSWFHDVVLSRFKICSQFTTQIEWRREWVQLYPVSGQTGGINISPIQEIRRASKVQDVRIIPVMLSRLIRIFTFGKIGQETVPYSIPLSCE